MKPLLQLPNIGNGGRLGNQLFTIAATIGLALKHGYQPRFPANWKYRLMFPNIPDEWFGAMEPTAKAIKEHRYEYCDLQPIGDVCNIINSYLQSPKYWEGYEAEIRYYLKPDGVECGSKDAVAIHYRRGDYVDNPNYVQLSMGYYVMVYNMFYKGLPIVARSDDSAFTMLHHQQASHYEVSDFKALAECKHHIISNSTFAWWAAYLGHCNRVTSPQPWFDGPLSKRACIRDLIPNEWLTMLSSFKQVAKDCTFIIPVMYDHQDRADNLQLVCDYIRQHFDTNIIVGEINTNKLPHHVHFDFAGKFHRTKALNEMTKMATTPYVINWDADVIVPPFQISAMIRALRDGADVVYPYDGTFAGVPRKYWQAVRNDLNLSALVGQHWRGFGLAHFKSVGGALGYNKEKFLKAGGENENFVSYAPEDQERYWRFHLLGMDVRRIDGPLYHLDHYRGPDSTMNNPDSRASHKYWDSIKHFDRNQIIEHLQLDW